jgi:hypothetical protein
MAVKRYNGTSWDTVAGKGEQGTSSSITTWVKTAAGGETSLTGSSDSSTTLAYTPGQEQFFINGVLQVRGSDYTATNGTSITGITALVAGDIATVTSVNAFSVTGAVPLSTVTANGDLIVGTSSGAVGRLGIGSTSQVLTVSGGVPTWATPATPTSGLTLVTRQSFSGVATTTTTFDGCFSSTYKNYQIVFEDIESSTNNAWLYLQYRYAGPTTQASAYYGSVTNYDHNGTTTNTPMAGTTQISVCRIGNSGVATNGNVGNLYVSKVGASGKPAITGQSAGNATTGAFNLGCTMDTQRVYTGFILSASAGNLTGTVAVYGLAIA